MRPGTQIDVGDYRLKYDPEESGNSHLPWILVVKRKPGLVDLRYNCRDVDAAMWLIRREIDQKIKRLEQQTEEVPVLCEPKDEPKP